MESRAWLLRDDTMTHRIPLTRLEDVDDEVCYASARELTAGYLARALSPLEVTRAFLDRIAALDPRLHTYLTVTADVALRDAGASEERYGARRPIGQSLH